MRPLVLAVSVMLLTPAVAYANPPAKPDRIGAALDMTFGGGLHLGGASDRTTWLTRVGAGISRGRTALLLSVSFGGMSGVDEANLAGAALAPTTTSFLEFGLEPSLRYELTRGPGWRLHLRSGWRWRWLIGNETLARTCAVNGGCDGGYYDDRPTYAAHGPTLAFGVGGRLRGDTWVSYGVELAIGHAVVHRPGTNPDFDDTLVTLGLNMGLGRGAR